MRNLYIILTLFTPLTVLADNSSQNASEISQHYSAFPTLYQFDAIKKDVLSDKITRQYVMGSQSMLVKWTFAKGAVIPLHFHANEETTWVTKGSVKVLSQGKEFIVKAGDVLIIPPNVPHEFYALEDTIDIEFFTHVREDWLNTASQSHSTDKK